MMMSLGLFLFTLPTIVYQDLSHKRDVRHAWNERIGAADAVQFIGPGAETISLSGVTAHGLNHPNASFAILNRMMQTGKAYPMIDGLGNVFGNYVIQSIDLKKSIFQRAGQARRNEFSIDLRRADNPGKSINNLILDKALSALANPQKLIASKLSIASLTKTLAKIKLPGLKI